MDNFKNIPDEELEAIIAGAAEILQIRKEHKKPIYGRYLVSYYCKYNKSEERRWKVEIKIIGAHLRWFKEKLDAENFIKYVEGNSKNNND